MFTVYSLLFIHHVKLMSNNLLFYAYREIVPRENMLSQNGHEHYVDRWRVSNRELRERIPLYVRT